MLQIVLIIISFSILFFSEDATLFINNSFLNGFKLAVGEINPDSNIVIIHINQADLEKIGPWPVKRSYYALLINSLTKMKAKVIGLEVFLSSRLVTQTVYDRLLTNEIEKSGKVILGSVAGKISVKDEIYYSDSLSLPSPKLLSENIQTGHLSLLNTELPVIPLDVVAFSNKESAFALKLSGIKNPDRKAIEVNFISPWKSFRNLNLLKYFELVQSDISELRFLEGKVVLIGVSDPSIAKMTSSAFGDKIPGVALHAFAVDNLINERYFKRDLFNASAIIFIIISLALPFILPGRTKRRILWMGSIFVLLLLVAFVLQTLFYQKVNLAFFVLPLLFLFASESVYSLLKNKILLKGAIDERELLKSMLNTKEIELKRLQEELDKNIYAAPKEISDKIKTLEEDIARIKQKEEDESAAKIKITGKNFEGIIYKSKLMSDVVDLIERVATENATVLVLGDSGTGKELVARALHNLSKRKSNPFIAVNCGALSDTLLESELFGHVKGAFTGAVNDKIGRFEAANNGTIFLDEISETSENFQVKLLRIIQSGEFEKVGSSKTLRADVRIIAASNRNIEQLVRDKKFREDLYYRLNVIRIELPKLKDRKEDIPVIADHFLKRERGSISFSQAVIEALQNYEWKGNVRELEGTIKRAVIFASSSGREIIQLSDLPKEVVKTSTYSFEDMVLESLRNKGFSHSSISETAKELGNVNRTMISENLRGLIFKSLFENNFNLEAAVEEIAFSEDKETIDKLRSKAETFLNNIKNDLLKTGEKDFNAAKKELSSKYKNLPQKFHIYLDETIKYLLSGK